MAKAFLTMMAQRFDMNFADKEQYNKGKFPTLHVNQSHNPAHWIELRERK